MSDRAELNSKILTQCATAPKKTNDFFFLMYFKTSAYCGQVTALGI